MTSISQSQSGQQGPGGSVGSQISTETVKVAKTEYTAIPSIYWRMTRDFKWSVEGSVFYLDSNEISSSTTTDSTTNLQSTVDDTVYEYAEYSAKLILSWSF